MLRDALELIQDTAVKANSVQRLESLTDGRRVLYNVNGKIEEVSLGIPPRRHVMTTLESLLEFVSNNQLEGICSIWCSDEGVLLICNDDDRRDTVSLPLHESTQHQFLVQLTGGGQEFDQKTFVNLLYRTFGMSAVDVAPFRKLDFHVVSAAQGEFQHGKDRMGKSVASEVQGTQDIPTEITISVPLYTTSGETAHYPVRLDVDIDAKSQLFWIAEKPGELENAKQQHLTDIRYRISATLSADVKTYTGKPGRIY